MRTTEGDDLNGLDAELIDNITYEGDEDETMFVGLKEKQKLHLSGVFRLQVVKGGIVYNNVHYNASREILTFWHPLSQSIPTNSFRLCRLARHYFSAEKQQV